MSVDLDVGQRQLVAHAEIERELRVLLPVVSRRSVERVLPQMARAAGLQRRLLRQSQQEIRRSRRRSDCRSGTPPDEASPVKVKLRARVGVDVVSRRSSGGRRRRSVNR